MSRNFALGKEFEAFIDGEVGSGRYREAEDVVRDGLRLLKALPGSGTANAAELRQLVEDARRDPALLDASAVFDRLEAKYERVARTRNA